MESITFKYIVLQALVLSFVLGVNDALKMLLDKIDARTTIFGYAIYLMALLFVILYAFK
jgi:hypothetical protein